MSSVGEETADDWIIVGNLAVDYYYSISTDSVARLICGDAALEF